MADQKKIYLIRHGQTTWSKEGKHTGRTDIPLTPKGEEEATLLKGHLPPIKKIFCSPLIRAKETCARCFPHQEPTFSPLLMEWNYGEYEGKKSIDIRKELPNWTIFKDGAPGGESPQEMTARMQKFCQEIDPIQEDIAIVAHAHLLRSLAAIWLQLPITSAALLYLEPASLSILGYEKDNRVIRLWNSTSHYKKTGDL